MTKLEMAKECMAVIYNVPLEMTPNHHPEIRGYMRLPKDVLTLKYNNRHKIQALTTQPEVNK